MTLVRYGKEQDKQTALTGEAGRDKIKLTKLELKNIQKKTKV
jgi:hypothetical protein